MMEEAVFSSSLLDIGPLILTIPFGMKISGAYSMRDGRAIPISIHFHMYCVHSLCRLPQDVTCYMISRNLRCRKYSTCHYGPKLNLKSLLPYSRTHADGENVSRSLVVLSDMCWRNKRVPQDTYLTKHALALVWMIV